MKKITEFYFQNGIEYAVISFITGFSRICSIDALKLLFADEIYNILHQTDLRSMLTEAEIVENVLFKGDFTADSKAIKFFCKYAASLSDERQKKLVKWLTGSTRLASGGFKVISFNEFCLFFRQNFRNKIFYILNSIFLPN